MLAMAVDTAQLHAQFIARFGAERGALLDRWRQSNAAARDLREAEKLQRINDFIKAQFALSKDEATRGWQKRALRQD